MNRLWDDLDNAVRSRQQSIALHDIFGNVYSYDWLGTAAEGFVCTLKELFPDYRRVAILSVKEPLVVAFCMACLQKEVTYVPLDVLSPWERIKSILLDGDIHLVLLGQISIESFGDELIGLGFSIQQDSSGKYWARKKPDHYHANGGTAYILYTSGSTGKPKGVCVSYNQAYTFARWAADKFRLTESDVVASIAPLHFDLSIFDIFSSLISGASVLLFGQKSTKNPRLLVKMFKEVKVSVVYTTPSVLNICLGFGKWPIHVSPELRLVLSAGEVLNYSLARRLLSLNERVELFNLYGPTETNVITYHMVDREEAKENEGSAVPIGQSCPYAELSLSEHGALLCVGPTVAQGYLKGEGGFFQSDGKKAYDTGDLVDQGDDGLYYYKGRRDRQVKSRGNRIDLGEIESAFDKIPETDQAIVGQMLRKNESQLVAFFTTRSRSNVIESSIMKQKLGRWLPLYMMPDRIVHVTEFPMTTHHKVDWNQLLILLDEKE